MDPEGDCRLRFGTSEEEEEDYVNSVLRHE
jgi:hypothetical protein